MYPSSTHASLLSRVRDPADNGAWSEFVRRYGDLILHYGLARGLQFCDAEDARQVVLLYLSRALREFRYSPERGRFRDYLGTAVRNAVNRMLACPKATRGGLSMDGLIDAAAATERDALWEQEWVDHHYRRAIEAIRPACEAKTLEVFQRLLAGARVADVAAELDMTPAAVQKIRERLRARLHEQVALQIREEEATDD